MITFKAGFHHWESGVSVAAQVERRRAKIWTAQGSHDGRKWGIWGKTRLRNLSRREPGGWPGPTLDVNKVSRLGASTVI